MDKLRKVLFDILTVDQLSVELQRLVLQTGNFVTDVAQVRLETEQHVFHSLNDLKKVDDVFFFDSSRMIFDYLQDLIAVYNLVV